MNTLAVPAALPRSDGRYPAEYRREHRRGEERDADRQHRRADEQAPRGRHRGGEAQPERAGGEAGGGQTHRRKPVGQRGEKKPTTHDNRPIHHKDDAPGLEPDLSRVQRSEGEEAGRGCHPGEQPESRAGVRRDGSAATAMARGRIGQRLRDTCGKNRSHYREERRRIPTPG